MTNEAKRNEDTVEPLVRPIGWRKEARALGLSRFHRVGAAIIAQVNGDEAALRYVRALPSGPGADGHLGAGLRVYMKANASREA